MTTSTRNARRRPRAGDAYDRALHTFEVLDEAGLGVSYEGLTLANRETFRPVLVRMMRPALARARSAAALANAVVARRTRGQR